MYVIHPVLFTRLTAVLSMSLNILNEGLLSPDTTIPFTAEGGCSLYNQGSQK